MTEVYSRSRIVINACLKNDLNTRILRSDSCCCFSEMVGEDIFGGIVANGDTLEADPVPITQALMYNRYRDRDDPGICTMEMRWEMGLVFPCPECQLLKSERVPLISVRDPDVCLPGIQDAVDRYLLHECAFTVEGRRIA